MAYNDIQKLRQQYVFNPVQDISGGGMNMMGYAPRPSMGGYNPPIFDEGPRDPFGGLNQPSTGPTFPDQGGIVPIEPPKTVTPGSSVDPNASLDRTMAAINRVYTPETVDRDRLRALLDAAPKRERPSFARSLVAAGLSLKAEDPVKTAEAVQYAPYYRAQKDWLDKTEPFYKGAQLENTANINERTLAGNVVTAQTQADRLASQERIAAEKNRISEIRAKAYAWKQMHPEADWDTKGPTYVLKMPDGSIKDTGIPTGQMSREDELLLINKGRVAAAEASGTAALNRAQVGGQGLIVVDGKTYRYNPDTGEYEPAPGLPAGTPTRPGVPRAPTAGAKTNTLEDRRIIQDRMKIQYETDPIARQFITKGTNGIYSMKTRPVVGADKPGLFTGDYTQDDVDAWDNIKKEHDSNYKPPTPTQGIGPSGTSTAPSSGPTGGRGGQPGTGLGPSNLPGGGRGAGPGRGGAAAQPIKTQTDAANPQHKRGTFPDGSVKESFDGGKTWK